MRFMGLLMLLLLATPAFSMSDRIIDYCLTTANPTRCIQTFLSEERQAQRDEAILQYQAQVNAARAQAEGLMLFGTGPALIQGMNQGFQNMQIHPLPIQPLPPPVLSR